MASTNNTDTKNPNSRNFNIEFSVKERKVLLFCIDSLLLILGLYLYFKIDSPQSSILELIKDNLVALIYGGTLFFLLSMIFNLYNLEYANKSRKIFPLVSFIGLLFSITFVFTPIITPSFPNQRIIVLGFILGLPGMLVLWRIFYARVLHAPVFLRDVIVIVSNDFDDAFIEKVRNTIEGLKDQNGYNIKRIYSLPTNEEEQETLRNTLDRIVDRKLVTNIIILDTNHENISSGLNKIFIKAIQNGIDVQTYLKLYEELREALPLNLVGRQFYSIFPIARYNSNYFYQLWNRTIDIIASLFGLLFTSLLIPFIAIANYFTSKGPLFYSQPRVGKGGIEYKLTKFRSMVVEAENSGAKMATKGDARVTKLGKILRKTRIDELPQFWAVLKGDMSLIGPRPERMVFVNELAEELPFYNARHIIKPGITGWAQVKYPYGENFEDSYNKLEFDLFYIKNRSITLDIRIILNTINSVIFSKGQ